MGNFLNENTLEYRLSVNDPLFPFPPWIANPDMSAVDGVDPKYWKLEQPLGNSDNRPIEMSQAEKDAVDAAAAAVLETDQKTEAEQIHDELEAQSRALRAVVTLTVDELNSLRTQWRDFQAAIAASNNLNEVKAAVAALPILTDRTYGQVRTAISNNIQGE